MLSIVSYITIIGWVISYVIYSGKTDKSSLEKFHLKQSLGLGLIGFIYGILTQVIAAIVPSIAMILSLVNILFFVLWIIGIINASKEEEKELPVIGSLFVDKFDFIK